MKKMHFITTNCRSIIPKINSMYDYFDELDLSFAIISETWLKEGKSLEKLRSDMKHGYGLGLLHKNRPRHPSGKVVAGGGVGLIYDPKRISFKDYPIRKTNYEIMAALGKVPNLKRKILAISAYIPPKNRASHYKGAMNHISYLINKVNSELVDPYVVVGGSFNRYKMTFLGEFADIEEIITDTLDKCCTNMNVLKNTIRGPLTTETGTKSDHNVIATTVDLKNIDNKYATYTA